MNGAVQAMAVLTGGRVEPEFGVQPFEQLAADTIDRTFTRRRA
jgi:hypothetical protein